MKFIMLMCFFHLDTQLCSIGGFTKKADQTSVITSTFLLEEKWNGQRRAYAFFRRTDSGSFPVSSAYIPLAKDSHVVTSVKLRSLVFILDGPVLS